MSEPLSSCMLWTGEQDDANQCLHNKSGSHGVPNTNLSNFACLLVDFGKVLCSSANELQQNSNASSREEYIPQILTVLLEILRLYILSKIAYERVRGWTSGRYPQSL